MYFIGFSFILLYLSSVDCFLSHTNIGKFLNNIRSRILNHTLNIPNSTVELKVDKNVLDLAFKGFKNIVDDPLVINEQRLDYEMKSVVRLHGYLKNLEVKYLKKMVLDHVYISEDMLYSEFVIRMPMLEITGFYNSSCYLEEFDLNIYGNGSFGWNITDLTQKVNLTLNKMQTEFIQLDKIDFDQLIGSTKFEIKNLLNDEAFSSVVSNIISNLIIPLHDYFKSSLNQLITSLIALYSEVLGSNMTAKEFVAIIYAFKEKATNNLKN